MINLINIEIKLIKGDSINLFYTINSELKKQDYVCAAVTSGGAFGRYFKVREDYAEYLMIKYPGRIKKSLKSSFNK